MKTLEELLDKNMSVYDVAKYLKIGSKVMQRGN